MTVFQLAKTNVRIQHVNIRKDGPEDDQIPALDIKMTAEGVDGSILEPIIGADQGSYICLWDLADEERNPRFWGMTECKAETVLEGRHEIQIGIHTIRPTKISKFVFVCRPGGKVDLTFSVSIIDPPRTLIELLAERLKDILPIDVIPDPDLFDEVAA